MESGKVLFAVAVAAMLASLSVLSFIYLGDGHVLFTGQPDDADETDDVSNPDDIGDDSGEGTITLTLAPEFSYPAVNGGTVTLASLRGKVVVLDFMATWCSPCKSQISNMKQIYDEYRAKNVEFISIDVDQSETSSELLAFRNDLGATWPFALDAGGLGRLPEYSASSIPTMVFVNKDGYIAQRDVGLMSVTELRVAIDPLLQF